MRLIYRLGNFGLNFVFPSLFKLFDFRLIACLGKNFGFTVRLGGFSRIEFFVQARTSNFPRASSCFMVNFSRTSARILAFILGSTTFNQSWWGVSLADTKAGKNFPQQIIRTDRSGNFRKTHLSLSQIFGDQFPSLAAS